MTSLIAAFISRRWSVPLSDFHIDVQPLRGGLESQVARARISREADQHTIPTQLVVKQLAAGCQREGDVYELLWRHFARPPAPRMLGRETAPAGETYLYLEHAQASTSWPWSDASFAGAVCQELARLHDSRALPRETFSWDYEGELAQSAEATLAVANEARNAAGQRYCRRLGDLRRIVGALPRIRERLLSGSTTVIHGDMHPGNVILRDDCALGDVVLIDWARARVGSPFEDVASWLHSLGCWEPEARRRHDTLMRTYLQSRQQPQPFSSEARVEYWLAAASNGLSGAIRYHLAVLADPATSDASRYDSARALTAWERVVRQAAAIVNTNLDRCTQ